jgi:hypothetical protein
MLAHRIRDTCWMGIVMAIDNLDRLAKKLNPSTNPRVKTPTLVRRQGQVTAVNSDGTVQVSLGGDPTSVTATTGSNYVPKVDDVVNADINGHSIVVQDSVGAVGPSVFANAVSASVTTSESGKASAYADLTTVGPTVSATISASGMALVGISVLMTATDSSDGGMASISINGSTPDDAHCVEHFASNDDGANTVSRTMLITGLTAGTVTFKIQYKAINGSKNTAFSNRDLWVLPL